MTDVEREKYLKAYYDNEESANKQMSFANAFAAILLAILWILYLTNIFKVYSALTTLLVNIIFPVDIVILLTPLLYVFFFKDRLRKPGYKYFVIFSFMLVITVLNTILPKHSVLGWALCIVMTNHYYTPKLGKIVFFTIVPLSLICQYASMFVGEFDANLLLGNGILASGEVPYADGIRERYELLHQLLLDGENRYLDSLIFYYLPRIGIITLIFFVSNGLNKRTYSLLVTEIQVSNEQARTNTELDVAKDIQLATLPVEFATSEDIEIQAELKAASSVGGDFYDYFILDDDHTALLIGDVSGKGIPAAMFMMKTITCFRNFVSLNRTPAETLKEVNRVINSGNDTAMFVTCFYAIINTKTGEMQFANAGHNPPVVGQKQNYSFLKCNSGFVLGPLAEVFVKDETYQLQNGDTFTLYTDGITEAKNEKSELYGEKRLIDLFNSKNFSCLLELHHSLKDDIAKFIGRAEQSDDMTYITLKYHGDHYSYLEKTFSGVMDSLPKMLDFISGFVKEKNVSDSFANNLMVVSDEMLSNIVKYGYKDKKGDIYLRLLFNADLNEFVMTIIDRGEPFDPFSVDNKPLEGDVSEREEGGLGILIVKNIMDEYAYDYINQKNIVTLKKRF